MQPTRTKYDIGSIYWLPARDRIPLEYLYATVHIDSGCFNHPALILWVNSSGTEAIILLITSFGGTDLQLRHPHDIRARSLHLPIYPSNTHPDNGCRLFLKDDARLHRNSYVKIEPQRTVKTVLLVRPHRGVFTLRKDSYKELVRHISFHPPTIPPHQKARNTPDNSRDHGGWLNLVVPAAEVRVKPLPVGHVQQAIPSRPVQQPLFPPYQQHGTFGSSHTHSSQTERTPLLASVRPVAYATPRARTYTTPSRARASSCEVHHAVGMIVLAILVWLWWRMADA